jgi:hypothetical protein
MTVYARIEGEIQASLTVASRRSLYGNYSGGLLT